VIPVVVGSNPIIHPSFKTGSSVISSGPLAQLVEQLTLNQLVEGSNPSRPTNYGTPTSMVGVLLFRAGNQAESTPKPA
jgi:hypothetical protein